MGKRLLESFVRAGLAMLAFVPALGAQNPPARTPGPQKPLVLRGGPRSSGSRCVSAGRGPAGFRRCGVEHLLSDRGWFL